MAVVPTWSRWRWIGAWSGVLALNVPIPLLLAMAGTSRSGEVAGLWAGVGFLWLAGLATCAASSRLGITLIRGGLWVAPLHFTVIPLIIAAVAAEYAWKVIVRPALNATVGAGPEAKTFVMTLLTALPFLLLAWVLGGGPRQLFGKPETLTPEQADYL